MMRIIDAIAWIAGLGLLVWLSPYIITGLVLAAIWLDAIIIAIIKGNW